jgi:threonine synthase
MYFENRFPQEFEVLPDPALVNAPELVHPGDLTRVPAPGKPLTGDDLQRFIHRVTEEIAGRLQLEKI